MRFLAVLGIACAAVPALAARTAPPWREPIGRFLNSEIDAPALRHELLGLGFSQPAPLESGEIARIASEFIIEDDAFAAAKKYSELSLVLGAFLPEENLSGLKAAAARLVPENRRIELLDAVHRTGEALARSLPDGSGIPPADGRPVDDASMDLRLEVELGFLRDVSGRVRLDEQGAVAFDAEGFPEEESYSLVKMASDLLRDDPGGKWVLGEDRRLLERLRTAYDRTTDLIFSGGNELARSVRYAEPKAGGVSMTILDYVRTERFKLRAFWVWSNLSSKEAPDGYAEITGKTSKSPSLRSLKIQEFKRRHQRAPSERELEDFDSKVYSVVFWAAKPGGEYGVPDPQGMRVRVNYDETGQQQTLEVLAPVGLLPNGKTRWKGFFFKQMGGEWVSGSPTKLSPSAKCIHCHFELEADGKKRHVPLPVQVRTKRDLLNAGYRDNTPLMEQYLGLVSLSSRAP